MSRLARGSIGRQATRNGSQRVDDRTAQQIESLRGAGRPLPESARSFFEAQFDHDFGRVRIHTGPAAAEAAQSINAAAFTVGRDIVFDRGQYRPQTSDGKALLGHELTHVVQQENSTPGDRATVRRKVLAGNVSCAGYDEGHSTIETINSTTPVQDIQEADAKAIRFLDFAISKLRGEREIALNQSVDDVSSMVSNALSSNLGIDPEDRSTWTGSGAGTVEMAIEWFENIKGQLESGNISYTCIGDPQECEPDKAVAYSIPGQQHIYLCEYWWNDAGTRLRALTLMHEVVHIYYRGPHPHNVGGAEAWENFLDDLVPVIKYIN